MVVLIEQPRESFRCLACGSGNVFSQGTVEHTFRSLPIGSRRVSIELAVPRVRCRNCGLVRQVQVQFAAAISTGSLEGLNNKIKTMQRQSNGFRNYESLRLKTLAIHRSQYAFVG